MLSRRIVPLQTSWAQDGPRPHGRLIIQVTALLATLLLARGAAAVTIDGQLDAAYGTALVIQTTQTGLSAGQIIGDNNEGDLNFANGSELDLGHALISDGVLHLFLAGNLAMKMNQNQNQTIAHTLDIFIDSAPGGQNTLNGLGAGHPLNGLTFDAGFEADYLLELVGDGGPQGQSPTWNASYADLTPQGAGTPVFLGFGLAGGPGTLLGGTNPHGILASIDNRNVAGVTFGCGASSGAGVTQGIEWAIPLAALGNPTECIRVAVIIRSAGDTAPVSNQVLAPVPPGTCPLGSASTLDFAGIAGDQFFTVCEPVLDVPGGVVPGFALLGVGPNPSRGDRVRVAFTLPDSRPARLQLIDCQGRVHRQQTVTAAGGGPGHFELADGGRLSPGIYWVRLSQGQASVARRICVVR